MTEAVTRRAFVFGVVAGSSAAAAGSAAAQEGTGTDGGATGTDSGEAGTDDGGAGTDGDGGGGGEPDYGGWFDGVDNFDGTTDATGQDSAAVDVGVENGDGPYGFGPAAVHVDNGATVTWTWTGEGGAHNVVEEGEVFDSGEQVAGEGETFEYTFEEDGIYKYVCEPHVSLGMKGAVVVGTDYPSTDGGGDGGSGSRPQVPDAARSLGLATAFAMTAALGLTYFFVKYGGDYAGFEDA